MQLSVVTTAYSIGLVVCVLFGGIAADRLPQRSVIVAADTVRGAVLLVIAGLALTGMLEIWQLAVGAVLIGAGEAFLIPAYTALVPKLLPADQLLAANGLEGTLRPLAQQATGPALGGLAIAALSPGVAILVAALTYLFSAACVLAMRVRPEPADQPAAGEGEIARGGPADRAPGDVPSDAPAPPGCGGLWGICGRREGMCGPLGGCWLRCCSGPSTCC